jgi:hypothetical protein
MSTASRCTQAGLTGIRISEVGRNLCAWGDLTKVYAAPKIASMPVEMHKYRVHNGDDAILRFALVDQPLCLCLSPFALSRVDFAAASHLSREFRFFSAASIRNYYFDQAVALTRLCLLALRDAHANALGLQAQCAGFAPTTSGSRACFEPVGPCCAWIAPFPEAMNRETTCPIGSLPHKQVCIFTNILLQPRRSSSNGLSSVIVSMQVFINK